MRLRRCAALVGLVVVGTPSGARAAPRQEPEKRPAQEAPADDPRILEAIARQRALGLPGPEHRVLAPLVGTYKVDFTSYPPAGEPTRLAGTAENRLVFGGRFLLSEWTVGEGDARIEAMTAYGYDNAKKQYFAFGINSLRTSMINPWGNYDAASRSFIMNGRAHDEATGTVLVYRVLLKIANPDSHVFQLFLDVPGRPPRKALEMTFTRQ